MRYLRNLRIIYPFRNSHPANVLTTRLPDYSTTRLLLPASDHNTTAKREFHLENEYSLQAGIVALDTFSFVPPYPLLPLVVLVTAVINNFAYSGNQGSSGETFDLLTSDNWATQALLVLALTALMVAIIQPPRA
ncbi:MAG: hypothetical protein M5U34_08075 [Chloroflexi bacterium]|nr:hypothetical protein [Chloroflexota bacterium]